MNDREVAVVLLQFIQGKRPDLIPADAVIRPATDDEDKNKATDAVIELSNGGQIRVGARSLADKGPRLFKIRWEYEGYRTEIDKIQSPDSCNWYLNSWHSNGKVHTISLLDVDKMRAAGDFEPKITRGGWKWRFKRWDMQSSYIYRFMSWIQSEGYEIYWHTTYKPETDDTINL